MAQLYFSSVAIFDLGYCGLLSVSEVQTELGKYRYITVALSDYERRVLICLWNLYTKPRDPTLIEKALLVALCRVKDVFLKVSQPFHINRKDTILWFVLRNRFLGLSHK